MEEDVLAAEREAEIVDPAKHSEVRQKSEVRVKMINHEEKINKKDTPFCKKPKPGLFL